MVKARLVILLTLLDGVLFRTKNFRPDYRYTTSYLATDSVDEVCIVNLGGSKDKFHAAAKEYCDKCFSPVTIGGKIKDLEEVSYLFKEIGADKVLVKSSKLALIQEISRKWGKQAVVAGVDYLEETGNIPELAYIPDNWMSHVEKAGAGEILLTSIDRDGSLQGYDLETIKQVADGIQIPLIASGGCGGWKHMKEALDAGASAVATSVIHHFTENSLKAAKTYLSNHEVEVRP